MNIQVLKIVVQKYLDINFIDEKSNGCKNNRYILDKIISRKNDYDEDKDIAFCQSEVILEPDLLNCMEDTFSKTLFKLIKRKGILETDCYKNSNLDRRLFSKIRSNDDYQPRKNTVFALIIGLKLNMYEAKMLLESAGYSISHSIKTDVIMECLIKHKVYDIITVNEILYSFNCPLLGQTC
ncbi:MAG: hypothetical protein IJZ30_03095 [Alphaproteobacteria bacterium]|nr:hypothetical protein [Alphaproteobacteria bacterium]